MIEQNIVWDYQISFMYYLIFLLIPWSYGFLYEWTANFLLAIADIGLYKYSCLWEENI